MHFGAFLRSKARGILGHFQGPKNAPNGPNTERPTGHMPCTPGDQSAPVPLSAVANQRSLRLSYIQQWTLSMYIGDSLESVQKYKNIQALYYYFCTILDLFSTWQGNIHYQYYIHRGSHLLFSQIIIMTRKQYTVDITISYIIKYLFNAIISR